MSGRSEAGLESFGVSVQYTTSAARVDPSLPPARSIASTKAAGPLPPAGPLPRRPGQRSEGPQAQASGAARDDPGSSSQESLTQSLSQSSRERAQRSGLDSDGGEEPRLSGSRAVSARRSCAGEGARRVSGRTSNRTSGRDSDRPPGQTTRSLSLGPGDLALTSPAGEGARGDTAGGEVTLGREEYAQLRTAVEVLKKLVYEKNSIIYQLECKYNSLRNRHLELRSSGSSAAGASSVAPAPQEPASSAGEATAKYRALLSKYNALKKHLLARELSTGSLLQSIAGNQRAAETSAEAAPTAQAPIVPESAIQKQYEALKALYASATRTIQSQGERIAELTAEQGPEGAGSAANELAAGGAEAAGNVDGASGSNGANSAKGGGKAEELEVAGPAAPAVSMPSAGGQARSPPAESIAPTDAPGSAPPEPPGLCESRTLLKYVEDTCRDFNSVVLVNRLPRELLVPYSVVQSLEPTQASLDRILLGTRIRGVVSFLRKSSAKPGLGAQ